LLVERAVAAQTHLLHTARQRCQGPLDHAPVAGAGGHVAVAELVGQDHILLRPQRHHRLKAGSPVVGGERCPLVAFQDGRIDVDRRHRLRHPLLLPGHQPPIGLGQALESRSPSP
jgi:hypothetical protein